MNKYFVVSYDDDQQQWFWDYVPALSEEAAVARVCEARPYVIAADATELSHLAESARELADMEMEAMERDFVAEVAGL